MNERYSSMSDEIKETIESSGLEKRPLFYYLADRDEDDLSDVEISEIVEQYLFDNDYQDYDMPTIRELLSKELKDVSRFYLSLIDGGINNFSRFCYYFMAVCSATFILWNISSKNIILTILFFAIGLFTISTDYYVKHVHDTLLAEKVADKLYAVKRISDGIEHYATEPISSYRYLTMNEKVTAQKPH